MDFSTGPFAKIVNMDIITLLSLNRIVVNKVFFFKKTKKVMAYMNFKTFVSIKLVTWRCQRVRRS